MQPTRRLHAAFANVTDILKLVTAASTAEENNRPSMSTLHVTVRSMGNVCAATAGVGVGPNAQQQIGAEH